ncbi:MAG TPA: DUF1488 family protein [Pseudolabrys sp.]|nr:DUF1488 family protein [Pseudolabrys sp.]
MRLILAMSCLTLALAAAAYAQGTDEQRAACADDYRTYCAYVPPDDESGILACFRQHRADITAACRKMIDAAPKEKPAKK